MEITLDGKVALVSGASKGIGKAIAATLAASGAKVMLNSRKQDQLEAAAAEMTGEVDIFACNAGDDDAGERAVTATVERFGGLDILVNNAGVAAGAPIEDFPLEEFDRLVAVNVRGVFAAIQRAVPHLGEGGRIITIGSVNADRVPMEGFSVYALTKAAVAGLTRGLVHELGPRGVTVNTIQPGPVATDMNPEEGGFSDQVRPFIAVGRYGQPHEIASAVAYLASAEAGYVTGVTWNVDGGFVI